MELQTQGQTDSMRQSTSQLPPAWAYVKEHLRGCLLCGRRRLAFIGGHKPAEGTQDLWFNGLRPGVLRVRFFGLCSKHFKAAKRSNMETVNRHFRAQMRENHTGTVH
jgi:hypothetical protein